ncbi:MAG TPA: permease, partial [Oceanipulchritudo sp.]|nr:permease [Oceanipulchritudo sp.]
KSCCSGGDGSSASELSRQAPGPALLSGLKFGFFTLPRDLFGALLVGLLLAGLIGTFVPQDFFASLPGGRFGVYLGMTLVSLPLYVCSTGSIPMAFTFLQAGMSPGAALLFLIAGPATNTATVTSLWKLIGPRGTVGYIVSIIATSWLAAILMDFSGLSLFVGSSIHDHDMGLNLFQHGMGALLVAVLIVSQVAGRFGKWRP